MSVWVVVGGQYGSEGKGKVSALITLQEEIDICVRCGGPNSGHCFVDNDGQTHILRQIPTGHISPRTRLLIPAGGLIDLDILKRELDALHLDHERVGIDKRAMVIEAEDRLIEVESGLRERLSSTLCGVGSAVARKALRSSNVRLAANASQENVWLRPFLVDTTLEVNQAIDRGKKVLVEGTQGFGLSLYHSDHYPKTTSRDTSAAGFMSECGISPLAVRQIVMVLRSFPIRVAGAQAGPMVGETDWSTIERESGYPEGLAEFTTVTGKLRRVASFDFQLALRAVAVNRPTMLAVNFMDYISYENRLVQSVDDLTDRSKAFLSRIANTLHTRVGYVGVGPSLSETFSISSKSLAPLNGELFDTERITSEIAQRS